MAIQSSDNFIIERGGTPFRALASDLRDYVEAEIGTVAAYDVANIAERNALTGLNPGDRVFVVDATGDSTVDSGWAIYVWRGSAFTKTAEEEGLDAVAGGGGANLSYTASPTQGIVVSSSGTDAILPAANATNAGLMVPAQFDKLGNIGISQPINIDAVASAAHPAVTLSGTTTTNPLTLSGQTLGFSISQLSLAP
jgi:hypothetical protein